MVPVTGMTTAEAVDYVIDRIAERRALTTDIAIGLRAVEGLLEGYVDTLAAVMTEAKQKS
jgi:hypothetical protein